MMFGEKSKVVNDEREGKRNGDKSLAVKTSQQTLPCTFV
jgi:hypothetical protein